MEYMKPLSTHTNVSDRKFTLRMNTLFGVLMLLVVFGFVYMSAFAQTGEEVQTAHIFPSKITSTDFANIESLYSQDLHEDALFGEFGPTNSAFVRVTQEVGGEDVVEVVATTTATTTKEVFEETESGTSTEEVTPLVPTTTPPQDLPATTPTTTPEAESENIFLETSELILFPSSSIAQTIT